MHYPQTAPTNVPHNSASGQSQYNQYSQSPSSNYSTAVNKDFDGNYSDASVPNRNQATYLNHVQNSYPNQKMPYQGDCQNKDQMQSSQYARYSETHKNESYRGSEGPPGTQLEILLSMDFPAYELLYTVRLPLMHILFHSYSNALTFTPFKSEVCWMPIPFYLFFNRDLGSKMEKNRNVVPNDGTLSSTSYQYSSTSTKSNTYTYAPPQQGHNKDALNNLVYPHQYNNRPQRAWLSEQNQHSHPHTGQRPQLKPQVNPSEGKQLPEVKSRKSWLSFQNSSQNKNKNQSVSTSIPTQNQTLLSAKTQPQSNVSPASQTSPVVKKPLEFPPNTVESTTPVAVKRRRCPAKRLGQIELWKLLLSLKSGLLAESTYALDCLGILLADNNTVVYFNLDHLPGLLTVLVDHLRCFLNKIFGIAEDMELRKSTTSHGDQLSLGSSDIFNNEGKINILDTPNFTYKTRCRKKIEIQYDEAVFLIDPQRSWDLYEDFDVSAEHWQKGGGDITSHIQTCFAENTKKVKFCRELTNEKAKDIKENHTTHDKSNMWKSSLLYKGEPVVVLKKVNFDADKAIATTYTGCDVDADDSCSVKSVSSNNSDKEVNCSDKEEELEKIQTCQMTVLLKF
ncbi:hypothetical protein CEXT_21291 [Caerostris extrusa]|uniref:Uncharacterized protein n=1 Tax=Caerostris extrusa TaxID=172846 RepID=A0AAV4QDQ7_CAEEX|nr:hypothetical protein CEXT_21291 [Caerostris extrusa]